MAPIPCPLGKSPEVTQHLQTTITQVLVLPGMPSIHCCGLILKVAETSLIWAGLKIMVGMFQRVLPMSFSSAFSSNACSALPSCQTSVQPSTAPTLKSHQQGEDQLLGSMGPLPLHRKSAQAFGSLEIGDALLDLPCLMCLLDTTALLCLPLHKPGDDAWSAPGCFAGAVDFLPKLFAW